MFSVGGVDLPSSIYGFLLIVPYCRFYPIMAEAPILISGFVQSKKNRHPSPSEIDGPCLLP